jgi:lipopolysaccharide transport system ATP-binding protein
MSEPIIIFDHVGKVYPLYHDITGGVKNLLFHLPKAIRQIRDSKFEALRDLSLRGEVLGIIGRNGSGKSTTLGLAAGVLKPTRGRVTVKGRVSPLLELGGGFHSDLTGRENIMLNGVLLGLRRADVKRKLNEIIEFSELGDFIDQPVRTYSSGMLARLGFSVVAALDPEILLIDEILAVGDAEFQKKCQDTMICFRKRGITMLFVSHTMEAVRLICDRVLWIENHLERMQGDPEQMTTQYTREMEDDP